MKPAEVKEFLGLTAAQVQDIGSYLVNRPYGEVEKLIEIFKNAPKLNVTITPPAPPEKPVAGEDAPPESTQPIEG